MGKKIGKVVITQTRCKMWTCDYCAKINREQWQARIIHGINTLNKPEWSFITLTAHENAKNYVTSMRNIQNGWKTLQTRIRRKIQEEGKAKSISYVRVYEQHKDGRVHWHMVLSWIPMDYKNPQKESDKGSRWVSDNARECGMGYQTKTLSIDGHGGYVASYVTKYLTKVESQWPKGTRIVQTSRDWPKKEIEESNEYHWTVQSDIRESDLTHWYKMGYEVYDLKARSEASYDNIDHNGIYHSEIQKGTTNDTTDN